MPMTPSDLAKFLRCAPNTLSRWRAEGIGPKWIRIQTGRILYHEKDVNDWMAESAVFPAPEDVLEAVKAIVKNVDKITIGDICAITGWTGCSPAVMKPVGAALRTLGFQSVHPAKLRYWVRTT